MSETQIERTAQLFDILLREEPVVVFAQSKLTARASEELAPFLDAAAGRWPKLRIVPFDVDLLPAATARLGIVNTPEFVFLPKLTRLTNPTSTALMQALLAFSKKL